jgi:hypothetical protein
MFFLLTAINTNNEFYMLYFNQLIITVLFEFFAFFEIIKEFMASVLKYFIFLQKALLYQNTINLK